MPSFVAIDVETANADMASICQIGVAVFERGDLIDKWSTLVDPDDYFDPVNVSIHGITERDVRGAPDFGVVSKDLSSLICGKIVVTHTHFDRVALSQACLRNRVTLADCGWLDSACVARRAWDDVARSGYGLAPLAKRCGIEFRHHDALEDAIAAGRILVKAIIESGQDLEWWMKRVRAPISSEASGRFARLGNPDGPLFGETIVFTGALSIPRKDAAAKAVEIGCSIADTVNKRVTLLVVGDQDVLKLVGHEKSSKHRKAEALIAAGQQIRILRESDFLTMISGQ